MYTSPTTLLQVSYGYPLFSPSTVLTPLRSSQSPQQRTKSPRKCEGLLCLWVPFPLRHETMSYLIRVYFFPALGHDKAQSIIDQITSAYESGGGPPPGGFGFGPQHLTPSGPGFSPPGYVGAPGFRRSPFLAP